MQSAEGDAFDSRKIYPSKLKVAFPTRRCRYSITAGSIKHMQVRNWMSQTSGPKDCESQDKFVSDRCLTPVVKIVTEFVQF